MDMNTFSLTKHDERLERMIKHVETNSPEHTVLAQWAIDCLKRFLPIFEEKYPDEITILHVAVATLKQWMAGEMKMWDARKYTFTVLALAREIEKNDKPYAQIVRATSHCLATCHVPTHSEGTAMYLVSAVKLIHAHENHVISLMEQERAWQIKRLKEFLYNI